MNILHNIIKGYVTSIIGVVIILATSYACTFKDMAWVWEGLAGCGFGCVLIFTPDSIKEIIQAFVKSKTK